MRGGYCADDVSYPLTDGKGHFSKKSYGFRFRPCFLSLDDWDGAGLFQRESAGPFWLPAIPSMLRAHELNAELRLPPPRRSCGVMANASSGPSFETFTSNNYTMEPSPSHPLHLGTSCAGTVVRCPGMTQASPLARFSLSELHESPRASKRVLRLFLSH